MKKIFTLLFTVGMFTLAQAQPGTRDNRQTDRRDDQPIDQRNNQRIDQRDQNNGYDRDQNYGYNNQRDVAYERNNPYGHDNRYGNGIMSPNRKRDMMIAQVNREYDFRTQKVWNSYFMNRWEKQRQVRYLEDQRQREIRMIYIKFSQRRDRDGKHDDDYGYGHRRY